MRALKLITKKNYLTICLTGLAVLSVYYLFKSYSYSLHDFSNYYFGSLFFLEGLFDKNIYDPTYFNLLIVEKGYHDLFVNYSPNSPFLVLFFAPFALLKAGVAKLLFNLISIISFIFSTNRLIKYLRIEDTVSILFLPLVFFTPIKNGILFGQPYLLIFAMLAEGYIRYDQGKKIPAVILWTIPAALKLSPGILILFLIARRDYKGVGLFLLSGTILLLLTTSFTGTDIFTFYLSSLSPKTAFGEIVSLGFYAPNQSLLMLFKYLFITDTVENAAPLIESRLLFILSISISYAYILISAFQNTKLQKNSFKDFALWLLLIFLISPYGSTYARILLLFAYLSVMTKENIQKVLTGIAFAFICNFPFLKLSVLPIIFRFPGLYALILIFLFSTKFTLFNIKRVIALSVLCTCFSFYFWQVLSKRIGSGEYLLDHNESLTLNYFLTGKELQYDYWYGVKKTARIPFRSTHVTTDGLNIQGGQLYLRNQKLTNSYDNKKKPVLVDGNKVIYLSDWGRGYGFYALRILYVDKNK